MNEEFSPLLQFQLETNLSPLTLPQNAKENVPPITRSLLKHREEQRKFCCKKVNKDPLIEIQNK
jgi:hypothetical protein